MKPGTNSVQPRHSEKGEELLREYESAAENPATHGSFQGIERCFCAWE
jgi:hypothetical protein